MTSLLTGPFNPSTNRKKNFCSEADDTSNSDGKQKEISPFLKPYINFFSGTEPVPKNESNSARQVGVLIEGQIGDTKGIQTGPNNDFMNRLVGQDNISAVLIKV